MNSIPRLAGVAAIGLLALSLFSGCARHRMQTTSNNTNSIEGTVPGSNLTFGVQAVGTSPLTYQWRFDTNASPVTNK
jgi:hypothetical protein